jgi:predicted hotdog family 3-hydroxylacyl-ACP dehydratase
MNSQVQNTFSIEQLVPHRADMSLLDEVINFSDEWLRAKVIIRPDSMFAREQGVPGWVGIEYMAQAVAAWAGTQSAQNGEGAKIGFLLGSRKFTTSCDYFPVGAELTISVTRVLQNESGLGSFDCHLAFGDEQQEARLNVFQPQDAAAFMAAAKGSEHV